MRILVIELHHFGDAVLAIPFLNAASAHHEVTVYCRTPVAAMLRAFLPGVHLVEAPESWGARAVQAARELRALRPEVSVCAWADARAHALARLAGARRRIGFPTNRLNFYAAEIPWRRRRLTAGRLLEGAAATCGLPLLTDPLTRGNSDESHLENWRRIAACLGLKLDLQAPWFPPPDSLPSATTAFLAAQRRAHPTLWAVLAGGRLPTKRWPLARFQEILREVFAARGWPVLILAAPGEEAPEPVGERQMRMVCSSHAELAAALSRVDAVLCNDSYPSHLAAALGRRVHAVFGSGEPAWFAPWNNVDRVIQNDVCPHHPCIDRCVMPSVVCLEAVTTAQVASALAPPAP